jgi:hypothetical protein
VAYMGTNQPGLRPRPSSPLLGLPGRSLGLNVVGRYGRKALKRPLFDLWWWATAASAQHGFSCYADGCCTSRDGRALPALGTTHWTTAWSQGGGVGWGAYAASTATEQVARVSVQCDPCQPPLQTSAGCRQMHGIASCAVERTGIACLVEHVNETRHLMV